MLKQSKPFFLFYWLDSASHITIKLYNVALEPVAVIEEEKDKGWQTTMWNTSYVAPGIYIYRIEAVSRDGRKKAFPVKKIAIIK
ncbi:MAG: hypothetical protein AB1630_09205 [bacterium]